VIPHAPEAHIAVPPVALQTAPQRPQFDVELCVFTSHPSAALMLQSAKPALQVNPHAPAAQVDVALARAGHAVPHAPQFDVSVARLTQRPPQLVSPAPHTSVHAPAEQT
jgi:hypothetical protein